MADEVYDRWPEAPARHEDRGWIPAFCARCHADPEFMRGFNPALATDQYAKYEKSQHGVRLLGQHDSKAAQCVSCHGAHGIRGAKSPNSKIHPQRVPYTCGECHADAKYMAGYRSTSGHALRVDQLAEYEKSVHGRALLERRDLGAPACNDCHGNHAALPPATSSIAEVCRTCHADEGEQFDGSKHKEAFEREGWAECTKCHGSHAIAEAEDSMLDEKSNPLCYDCHREYAKESPLCMETARHFSASIAGLAGVTNELDGRRPARDPAPGALANPQLRPQRIRPGRAARARGDCAGTAAPGSCRGGVPLPHAGPRPGRRRDGRGRRPAHPQDPRSRPPRKVGGAPPPPGAVERPPLRGSPLSIPLSPPARSARRPPAASRR
jgi:predicted CXXCH cytochrome family protein